MLGRFLPRKTDFFALFARHAALTVEAARRFEALLDDLEKAEAESTRIRALEHEADGIRHQTMDTLHRTFVTPIDRGDIHALSSRLDDIMDHVESAAQRIWLYRIQAVTPELRRMVGHLREACEAVNDTVVALGDRKRPERIREQARRVRQVEKENDRLLRASIATLFREEEDARELIKWKEIYETIETAIDRCEDVADVVEGVVLEND